MFIGGAHSSRLSTHQQNTDLQIDRKGRIVSLPDGVHMQPYPTPGTVINISPVGWHVGGSQWNIIDQSGSEFDFAKEEEEERRKSGKD